MASFKKQRRATLATTTMPGAASDRIDIIEPTESDYLFKIVVVGDSAVGKTNLLLRHVNNDFKHYLKSTIGVDFYSRNEKINGKTITCQFWDTAGQEKFRALSRGYYRLAVGALLVFDITRRETYEHLNRWIEEIRELADPKVEIIIVGNKSDLHLQRKIPLEEAQNFAQENNLSYMETSAFNSNNVKKCFESLARQIYTIHFKNIQSQLKPNKSFENLQKTGKITIEDFKSKETPSSTTCCTLL